MDRNTILAMVLSGTILVVWMYFFAPKPPAQPQKQNQTQQQAQQNSSTPPADASKDANAASTSATASVSTAVQDSLLSTVTTGTEQLVTVENELFKAQLSSKGGTLKSLELKKFTKYNKTSPVQLVSATPMGALGLEFSTPWNRSVDTRNLYFTLENPTPNVKVGDKTEIAFSVPLKEGKLRQVYTFQKDSYELGYRLEMQNAAAFTTKDGYDLVWHGGVPFSEQGIFQEAEGANAHARWGGELVSFDIGAGAGQNKLMSGKVDWVSVKNRFFTAALIPSQDTKGAELNGKIKGEQNKPGYFEEYNARLEMNQPQEGKAHAFKLFLGPIDHKLLEPYNLDLFGMLNFSGFMGGMMRFIVLYIFLPIFGFFHNFITNYGIIILLFALLVKIVLHPLTASSMKSMAKMKLMQPKMQAVQEQYKDNPQKQQQEMVKLYQEAGANPLGGCLPLLLQMPILFAMYQFFPNAIDLRQEAFLWAKDLSAPDVLFHLPFTIPFYGNIVTGFSLLMTISMVFQMKLQGSSTPEQPGMQVFQYLMPVMMLSIFNGLSSGLNLYYFAFNIYSMIQQKLLNNQMEKQGLVEAKPKKEKPAKGKAAPAKKK